MDKGSKPAGNTTTTQTSVPYGPTATMLGGWNTPGTLYNKAYNVGNTPLSYFPGQTYANPTDQQQQAIQLQGNLATNDPVMHAATGGIQPYLNGSMLSAGNPYFGNMVNQIGQAIQPSIDSHFNMNGRGGSGANNQAFASALANTAGNLAYTNYNDQSTNQLKSMLEAPGISQGNFADIGQLASAGAQQQAFNQLPITEAMNRFQYNQDAPFMAAQRMQSLMGNSPTSTATSSPYFTNPTASTLGGLGALFGGSGVNGQGPSLFNQMGGGSLMSGAGSLWSQLFGGIGGAGGSGLSADAMGQLSTDAMNNIGSGFYG